MAEVRFENVRKVYDGGVQAVNDMSLTVEDGSLLVLVGPSGCGKSTSLRMVAGLEDITGGAIYIDEEKVNDVLPKDRDIAMVFQNYALYPHMTVYGNMSFGLRLRKYPKDEIDERVRYAADLLEITPLLQRRPRELSGGQAQRVAVGRAIVRNPKVFLFDEPLSNLDAKLRVQMRVEIAKLHERLKATMIYVTHDQVEAMTLGDRVAVMHGGDLLQVAPPLELYNRPVNKFVGGFIGSPPMNFLPGRLSGTGGTIQFDGSGVKLPLTPEVAAVVGSHVDSDVLLGIRPEDIHDTKVHPAAPGALEQVFTVSVVEPLGAETLVYLSAGEGFQDVVAKFDPRSMAHVGQQVRTWFNAQKAHVFDADTEKSLTYEVERAVPE